MTLSVEDAWADLITVWDTPPAEIEKLPKKWHYWFRLMGKRIADVSEAFEELSYADSELRAVERRLSAQIQGIHNGLLKARLSHYYAQARAGSGKRGATGNEAPDLPDRDPDQDLYLS